jgi:SpoVK/Ycf46/Vps4 family AAA+-type ATPase
VLQFDEADSLFGKRGEIRDARDRYANLEVSHLLARIEQHDGPCLLTTNLRGNLDPAFTRRFQVVIDFPRPDLSARGRLWRLHVPPRAPLAPEVDFDLVAGAVHLTGGGIRNAAMHAAFLAAAGGRAIGMPELTLAIWRELGKDGRSLTPADLGPLAAFTPRGALC